MGNLEKMQTIGDVISYFFPYYLIVALKSAQKSNRGKIYDILFPCFLIFSPLGHAIIVLLSQAVYWGKIFFPLAMLYGIYFTFLLVYELKEKQYNIFPPGPVFFLLVTEKLVKKLIGERKMVFSPISIFFPLGPCCSLQCSLGCGLYLISKEYK
jgi:hypothetical protein